MFKAGFARVDITPPFGTYIPGYFEPRYSKGILDPLYLNVLAYSDGTATNLVMVCDMLGMATDQATIIRELVSRETGVPMKAVYVTALHQHTAFALRPGAMPDDAFMDVLRRKFRDAAKVAIDDLKDAEVFTGTRETPVELSFVRRYRMKDGKTATNPGINNPLTIDHVRPADNTVRFVRFRRSGGKDIALVNFTTHPDTVGGELYTADWPGFVRTYVEKDLPDVHCIALNGAQGDVNHVDYLKPAKPWQLYGYPSRYEYTRKMGKVIAGVVVDLCQGELQKHPEGRLFAEAVEVTTPTNRTGEDKLDEALALMKDHDENGGKYTIEQLGNARRIINLSKTPLTLDIPVAVQGFSDIAFVGFGGEPFTEYGEQMRAAAPGSFVLATCLTNGSMGYLPTKEAFDEGGYEARSSRFTGSLPSDLLGAAKELFKKYDVK